MPDLVGAPDVLVSRVLGHHFLVFSPTGTFLCLFSQKTHS